MSTLFKTKTQARNAVIALGCNVLDGLGQSGDYAYGSREYYSKPNSPRNDYGASMDHAEISKLPGHWVASVNYKDI